MKPLAVLVNLLLLTACGGGSSEETKTAALQPADRGRGPCQTPFPTVPTPSGVSVRLTLPQSSFAAGEPIAMTIEVRHQGGNGVTYWHSGQTYDFWVEGDGERVWRWSEWAGNRDGAFQQFLARKTLKPGDELGATETWDQTACPAGGEQVAPGRYRARALWVAGSEDNQEQGWWSNEVVFDLRAG